MYEGNEQRETTRGEDTYDLIIVGAGFAGMMALHHAREIGLNAIVLEAGGDVGGTWYWNRYPGLRCDIESHFYSYSFDEALQQEWEWTERYATQGEILSYARHVADRFDLRSSIRFNTRVASMAYDEQTRAWTVRDDQGAEISASWVIMATGALSAPKEISLPGLDDFAGTVLKTTDWPGEGVDLSGKRVAVLGTGSTGIQVSTALAPEVEHLYVLQRTPSYSVFNWNRRLDPAETAEVKAKYSELRAECRTTFDGLILPGTGKNTGEFSPEEQKELLDEVWADGRGFRFDVVFEDTLIDPEANQVVADYLASKIHEIVRDEETARKLTPSGYPYGTRRICMDAGYYDIFNRENTTLVDLLDAPLEGFTDSGFRTEHGVTDIDVLILATGYDAATGALSRIDITGRGGQKLAEHWADGASTFMGLAVSGFPNMFIVTGPQSPSFFTNVVASIEQHVEWLTGLLSDALENDIVEIEATADAERAWVERNEELAASTLHSQGNSWFSGANVAGKPRKMLAYVGGLGEYGQHLARVRENGYEGMTLVTRENVIERTA